MKKKELKKNQLRQRQNVDERKAKLKENIKRKKKRQ